MSKVSSVAVVPNVGSDTLVSSSSASPQSYIVESTVSAPVSSAADTKAESIPLEQIMAVNRGALQLLAAHGREVNNAVTGDKMTTVSAGVISNWDTGMALITELTMRTRHESIPEMVKYVCSQQNADGGWSDSVGDKQSGPTASLVNHAALVAYRRQSVESGDATHWDLVDEALKRSWKHLTGKVPSAEKLLDPLPTAKVLKAAPFGMMYYFNVFEPVTTRLPLGKILAFFLPSSKFFHNLMKKRGMMPQLQDFLYGAILRIVPPSSLETKKLKAYADSLLHTRSEGGLYCYLPMLTGLAVMALDRASGAGNDTEIASLAKQSLEASRQLYVQGADGVRVSAYSPDTFYSIDYTISRLLADPMSLGQDDIKGVLRYILASRATDGNFHQQYRSDEAEDGMILMSGKVLQLTGVLFATITYLKALGQDVTEHEHWLEEFRAPDLVRNLILEQNKDGGFSIFRKTDVSSKPGAMKDMSIDSSTPIATANALSGLAVAGLGNSSTAKDAIERLRLDFKPGAGWWSRFGGGFLPGNATVIAALRASGVAPQDQQIQEVVALLHDRQNKDGGWGETPRLVDNPKTVAADVMRGESHPQLTAYGIMALLDAGVSPFDPALTNAVNYLLREFKDPSGVLEKLALGQGEQLTFAERDQAGWAMPYATTTFSPPQYGWYVADQTIGDLHPILALQKYLLAVIQSQQQVK